MLMKAIGENVKSNTEWWATHTTGRPIRKMSEVNQMSGRKENQRAVTSVPLQQPYKFQMSSSFYIVDLPLCWYLVQSIAFILPFLGTHRTVFTFPETRQLPIFVFHEANCAVPFLTMDISVSNGPCPGRCWCETTLYDPIVVPIQNYFILFFFLETELRNKQTMCTRACYARQRCQSSHLHLPFFFFTHFFFFLWIHRLFFCASKILKKFLPRRWPCITKKKGSHFFFPSFV